MTTVVSSNAVTGSVHNDVFAPVTGRYVELTWYGAKDYGGGAAYAGGKVEVSADDVTYDTVLDQATAIGGSTTIVLPLFKAARYIRVTDYQSNSGALVEFEVHAIPPALGTIVLIK